MKHHRLTLHIMAGAAIALALTVSAQATIALNNRSFVATTGDDANNCTPAAYCRTFARALAMTNSGGEIVVVNSGGYGPFSIAQPVVITAIGIDAAVTQTAAGQNAITINTTGNVTITGLNLSGGGTGSYGVLVQNVGVLHLYNLQVQNFLYDGIDFLSGAALSIYDSTLNDNGEDGLATYSKAYVHNTAFDNNVTAGAESLAGSLAVADSSAQRNGKGFSASGGTIALENDKITLNTYGLWVASSSSLYFAHCLLAGNTWAYSDGSGGTISGSNPATSLIAPGQGADGALSTATALH